MKPEQLLTILRQWLTWAEFSEMDRLKDNGDTDSYEELYKNMQLVEAEIIKLEQGK
jgi:hypothetical protein